MRWINGLLSIFDGMDNLNKFTFRYQRQLLLTLNLTLCAIPYLVQRQPVVHARNLRRGLSITI
ncbi:hypothetical protein ACT3QR_10215 [Psychrobacter sp. AOP7-B1-25]|uniref:hypothetical protein n=1 Tax=Psychrobacter sp. AOP7-B1-25 TaxID=3457644 RepID=UPI00402BB126